MPRLIHTIALGAASVVLAVGLWKGWGLWASGRRMVLAYLGFFFLGAALTLVMRLVPLFEQPEPAAGREGRPRRRGTAKGTHPPTEA